ncbi:MAG: hypothetical protein C5B49_03060, partial [Bdellovibrio sp.]
MANLSDRWLLRNLTQSEARAVFAVLTPAQRFTTRLWSEGWEGWLPVDALVCEFLYSRRIEDQVPPAISFEETNEVTQVQSSMRKSAKKIFERKHQRYLVQIPVIVRNSTEQFTTLTEDISEGGIRLQDALPDQFAGYCQVILQPKSNHSFEVLASPVEDQNNGRHHMEFADSEE